MNIQSLLTSLSKKREHCAGLVLMPSMQILFVQIPDSVLMERGEEQAEQGDEQDQGFGELFPLGVRSELSIAKT